MCTHIYFPRLILFCMILGKYKVVRFLEALSNNLGVIGPSSLLPFGIDLPPYFPVGALLPTFPIPALYLLYLVFPFNILPIISCFLWLPPVVYSHLKIWSWELQRKEGRESAASPEITMEDSQKTKNHLPYDPATLLHLLHVVSLEDSTFAQSRSTDALFTVARKWNQPQYLSTDEEITKM